MNRRVRRIFLTGMLAVLMAALAFTALLSVLQLSALRGGLRAVLSAASAWTADSTGDLNTLAKDIARSAPPLRVTFLLPEGIVLADSEEDPRDMLGFILGPEVERALKEGSGERLSLDGGPFSPVLDMAGLVSGRLVLRLRYPLSGALRPLLFSLLTLPLLILLLMLWQRRSFLKLQRELDSQLCLVRELLEGAGDQDSPAPEAFFPEIRPAIVEILRLIDRMRDDLEQIRKTRDMRREFIANASHGLKNPLTAILGFAEMLQEGAADTPEKQAEYLHAIRQEGQRMMAVIKDILLLEKAEEAPADLEEISLAGVAGEVAESLLPQFRKKGVRITIQGETTLPARREDIRALLDSLMGNAVRYNREGGQVEVRLEPGRLTVQDNGIGIAPEHVPLIFEPFYRVESDGQNSAPGTGLGLSIAANIAHKYGGTIHVDSVPGEGSVFTVSFVRSV